MLTGRAYLDRVPHRGELRLCHHQWRAVPGDYGPHQRGGGGRIVVHLAERRLCGELRCHHLLGRRCVNAFRSRTSLLHMAHDRHRVGGGACIGIPLTHHLPLPCFSLRRTTVMHFPAAPTLGSNQPSDPGSIANPRDPLWAKCQRKHRREQRLLPVHARPAGRHQHSAAVEHLQQPCTALYSHRMLPVDTLQVTVECPSRAHWSDSRSRQLGEYVSYVLAPGQYPIQLGTFTSSGEAILQLTCTPTNDQPTTLRVNNAQCFGTRSIITAPPSRPPTPSPTPPPTVQCSCDQDWLAREREDTAWQYEAEEEYPRHIMPVKSLRTDMHSPYLREILCICLQIKPGRS